MVNSYFSNKVAGSNPNLMLTFLHYLCNFLIFMNFGKFFKYTRKPSALLIESRKMYWSENPSIIKFKKYDVLTADLVMSGGNEKHYAGVRIQIWLPDSMCEGHWFSSIPICYLTILLYHKSYITGWLKKPYFLRF